MSEVPIHQRFFAELKRRHVFRVMAVYGAVGFVVLQVVELLVLALLTASPPGVARAAAAAPAYGTEGMVVSYAKCCYPIPGDNIMGYLSSGRGVVIHRHECGNMINFRKHPEKWLTVSWERDIRRDFQSPAACKPAKRSRIAARAAGFASARKATTSRSPRRPRQSRL